MIRNAASTMPALPLPLQGERVGVRGSIRESSARGSTPHPDPLPARAGRARAPCYDAQKSRLSAEETLRALKLIAACLALVAMPASARADDWPSHPVRVVVAFGAGGSADILGRLVAAELSDAFNQRFFVENRPGNSGSIGSTVVARAEPDGYTLLIGGSGPHLTGPAINPNIGYDPMRDFSHIAMIAGDTYALAANPALGARMLADVIRLAHERPLASASDH